MWVSFLRENGRWSLYHRVAFDGDPVITVCGFEYDANLERFETEKPSPVTACVDCEEGTQPKQNVIRLTRKL